LFDEWNWWKLFAIESAKIYAGIALGQTDEGGANDGAVSESLTQTSDRQKTKKNESSDMRTGKRVWLDLRVVITEVMCQRKAHGVDMRRRVLRMT